MANVHDKLRQLIRDGEGLNIEFKRCGNELAGRIYDRAVDGDMDITQKKNTYSINFI